MAPDDLMYLQRVYPSIAPEIACILHKNTNLFFMLFSFCFCNLFCLLDYI